MTVIPVPAPAFKVTDAEVPPPVKPSPAPTDVTPEEELVPAPMRVLISAPVTPDAKVGVPPPLNIPGSAKDVKPELLLNILNGIDQIVLFLSALPSNDIK